MVELFELVMVIISCSCATSNRRHVSFSRTNRVRKISVNSKSHVDINPRMSLYNADRRITAGNKKQLIGKVGSTYRKLKHLLPNVPRIKRGHSVSTDRRRTDEVAGNQKKSLDEKINLLEKSAKLLSANISSVRINKSPVRQQLPTSNPHQQSINDLDDLKLKLPTSNPHQQLANDLDDLKQTLPTSNPHQQLINNQNDLQQKLALSDPHQLPLSNPHPTNLIVNPPHPTVLSPISSTPFHISSTPTVALLTPPYIPPSPELHMLPTRPPSTLTMPSVSVTNRYRLLGHTVGPSIGLTVGPSLPQFPTHKQNNIFNELKTQHTDKLHIFKKLPQQHVNKIDVFNRLSPQRPLSPQHPNKLNIFKKLPSQNINKINVFNALSPQQINKLKVFKGSKPHMTSQGRIAGQPHLQTPPFDPPSSPPHLLPTVVTPTLTLPPSTSPLVGDNEEHPYLHTPPFIPPTPPTHLLGTIPSPTLTLPSMTSQLLEGTAAEMQLPKLSPQHLKLPILSPQHLKLPKLSPQHPKLLAKEEPQEEEVDEPLAELTPQHPKLMSKESPLEQMEGSLPQLSPQVVALHPKLLSKEKSLQQTVDSLQPLARLSPQHVKIISKAEPIEVIEEPPLPVLSPQHAKVISKEVSHMSIVNAISPQDTSILNGYSPEYVNDLVSQEFGKEFTQEATEELSPPYHTVPPTLSLNSLTGYLHSTMKTSILTNKGCPPSNGLSVLHRCAHPVSRRPVHAVVQLPAHQLPAVTLHQPQLIRHHNPLSPLSVRPHSKLLSPLSVQPHAKLLSPLSVQPHTKPHNDSVLFNLFKSNSQPSKKSCSTPSSYSCWTGGSGGKKPITCNCHGNETCVCNCFTVSPIYHKDPIKKYTCQLRNDVISETKGEKTPNPSNVNCVKQKSNDSARITTYRCLTKRGSFKMHVYPAIIKTRENVTCIVPPREVLGGSYREFIYPTAILGDAMQSGKLCYHKDELGKMFGKIATP